MITVSRLYPDGGVARAVVDELKAAGLPEDDIGIIAPSRGGAAGLLAGLGAFVLPGIGAVVAAGWVANALAAAVAAGGVVGALTEAGISAGEGARLVQGISQGSTLVTVRVSARDRDYYGSIMAMTQMPKPLGPAAMPVQLRTPNTLGLKRP
jgi:hypothetical protein